MDFSVMENKKFTNHVVLDSTLQLTFTKLPLVEF